MTQTKAARGELFRFTLGNQVFCYSGGQQSVVYQDEEYRPRAIQAGAFDQTADMQRSKRVVSSQKDLEVAALYVSGPPEGTVGVTIFCLLEGAIWKGRISGVEFSDSKAEITCESVFTQLRRVGLRRVYQVPCPLVLYGPQCGKNRDQYRLDGAVAWIDGFAVHAAVFASKPSGWLAGGFVVSPKGRGMIMQHSGDGITLAAPIPGLAWNDPITAYAGCSRDLTACDTKFANTANFGGCPYLPAKNPFSGDALV
jgi:uncharacterized phage protein (TIGR02218 family)